MSGMRTNYTIVLCIAAAVALWLVGLPIGERDPRALAAQPYGTVAGHVRLQSRVSFGGVTIRVADRSVTTQADGSFALLDVPPGRHAVTASMQGFLSGLRAQVEVTAGGHAQLGQISLLAGDVNGDDEIDLIDLVLLGREFGKSPPSDPRVDLTADGKVNIFDLVLLGGNYGLEGPIAWPDAPVPTATATPTRTDTRVPTTTWTPEPSATSTMTQVPTATPTESSTPIPTATPTFSSTPVVTATATQTESLTPTPTATSNDLRITALQVSGSTREYIGITNYGPGNQNMTGWRVRSVVGNQWYAFPVAYVLHAGDIVKLYSGSQALHNPPAELRWTISAIWDDAGDEAHLYDVLGSLIDRLPYGNQAPTP